MASWKDTIKDDDKPVQTSSWKDSIQDEGPSKLDSLLSGTKEIVTDIGTPLLETAQDFSTGAAQGLTMGAADEIGGGIAALLEKGASYIPGTAAYDSKQVDDKLKAEGFQVPEESLVDTYRSYQQGSEQAFKAAEDRSPIANTIGNIGGSIASGTAIGGALGIGSKAKNAKSVYDIYKDSGKMKAGLELLKRGGTTYAKAAPAIAAESALVSEGNFDNEESRSKLGSDVASGLAFGVPTVLGLEGVTELVAPAAKAGLKKVGDKISDFADSSPFLRKYKIGMDHGASGVNPTSEAGLNALESQQIGRTKDMMDQVYTADKTLGQAVGKSLDDATEAGMRLDIEKPVTKALKALDFSYNTFQDMADDARGKKIFEKIQTGMNGDVTPREAKGLLDDIDAFIGKFNASRNRTTAEEATLSTLQKVRKEMSDQMKRDIPTYGKAAERFAEFRKLVPETILSKEKPVDVTGMFMGNLKNSDQKLYDSLNQLQMGATAQGSGASNSRKAYTNLMNGMKQFEANDLARGNKSPLVQSSSDFDKQLRRYSDEAGFLKDIQTVKAPNVTSGNVAQNVGFIGRNALGSSVLAGKVKKPIADLSRKAYNMPAEKLNTLATQMQNTPGLKVLGTALSEGLQNGDQAKKNAAIFSIMQNPEARLMLDQDEE